MFEKNLAQNAEIVEAANSDIDVQEKLRDALISACDLALMVVNTMPEFHRSFADLGYTVDDDNDPDRKMDHCWLTYDTDYDGTLQVHLGAFSDYELSLRDPNNQILRAQTLRKDQPDFGKAGAQIAEKFLANTKAEFSSKDMFIALGIIATREPRVPNDTEVKNR
jgi:hypothetical protein